MMMEPSTSACSPQSSSSPTAAACSTMRAACSTSPRSSSRSERPSASSSSSSPALPSSRLFRLVLVAASCCMIASAADSPPSADCLELSRLLSQLPTNSNGTTSALPSLRWHRELDSEMALPSSASSSSSPASSSLPLHHRRHRRHVVCGKSRRRPSSSSSASSSSSPVPSSSSFEQRLICPHSIQLDVDHTRLPAVIETVRCECQRPSHLSTYTQIRCQPLYFDLTVLKLDDAGAWRPATHRVSLACVPLVPAPSDDGNEDNFLVPISSSAQL